MSKSIHQLVDGVTREMFRVWGRQGLMGGPEEYVWLEENYGITERDDEKWLHILDLRFGDHDQYALALDDELFELLSDEASIAAFLVGLLERYRSSTKSYPGRPGGRLHH